MVITLDTVLTTYASLLQGSVLYAEADRWAWERMQLFDAGNLEFEPKDKEKLIWQLLSYLHGIDMPMVEDRTKTMVAEEDIIDFLKKNKVYDDLPTQYGLT